MGRPGCRSSSHAVVTWDYDNDGILDLYVAAASPEHQPEIDEDRPHELAPLHATVASMLRLPHGAESGRLYRGRGGFRFDDETDAVGLSRAVLTGGVGIGDLDNDGYQDLYLGTMYPGYEGLLPNLMYRNRAGAGFVDVTTAGGCGHLHKTAGIALADVDTDGDQDVLVRAGGMFVGDAFGDVRFENPGTPNHWLAIRSQGRESNRSAIGARIRCVIEGDGPPAGAPTRRRGRQCRGIPARTMDRPRESPERDASRDRLAIGPTAASARRAGRPRCAHHRRTGRDVMSQRWR